MVSKIYDRIPHIMKQRISTQIITNCLFFDCETKDSLEGKNPFLERHKLWFGFCIAWRIEHGKRSKDFVKNFTTVDQFFEILYSRLILKKPLYVFAHNLPFDMTIVNFWKQAEKRNITIDYFVADDPPSIFRCSYNNFKIVFIDTLNYWRTSLAKIGESIGITKGVMPSTKKLTKKWNEYCFNDCKIISEAIYKLLQFVVEHDLGAIGFTAASLAMNAFKKRFMKHEIFIHDNQHALKLERESYYGGRVQCFKISEMKKQQYYCLDVNSLYPSVMRYSYPTKLLGVINAPDISTLCNLARRYGVIARCYLNSSKFTFPKRYNERLCFVTGKYTTTLCGRELSRALETNSIQYCYQLSYYEVQPIFTSFVDFFWKLRQRYKEQSNNVYELFCKLLMNSLYGKFGQNGAVWTKLDFNSFREYVEMLHAEKVLSQYTVQKLLYEVETNKNWYVNGLDTPIKLRRLADNVQIKFPLLEHWESFPAIAAFVTSYAREYLLELINEAGQNNIFYCDTDSIFCSKKGYENLRRKGRIEESTLGKLKLVAKALKFTIYGPKDYIFGDKIVRKGIRHDAIKINENTFQQIQFEGLRSVIKRGGEDYIDINKINKTNKRIFNKGIVSKDGHISPYHLNEIMISFK